MSVCLTDSAAVRADFLESALCRCLSIIGQAGLSGERSCRVLIGYKQSHRLPGPSWLDIIL